MEYYIYLILIVVGGVVGGILELRKNFRAHPTNSNNFQIGHSFFTKVAGVTFRNAQSILPTIKRGAVLTLVRERNNEHDSNAVKVMYGAKQIGYLNRDVAADVAPIIDSGGSVSATVVEITGGRGKTYGCNIEITVYE